MLRIAKRLVIVTLTKYCHFVLNLFTCIFVPYQVNVTISHIWNIFWLEQAIINLMNIKLMFVEIVYCFLFLFFWLIENNSLLRLCVSETFSDDFELATVRGFKNKHTHTQLSIGREVECDATSRVIVRLNESHIRLVLHTLIAFNKSN